jgi:TRAP-type C4-dicarboxylate transport system permease small subunit
MISRILNALYTAGIWLAAAFVLAIFIIMVGGSAARELGFRTGGSDDLVAWSCAAAGFLAMADTFRRGDFVRVMLLLDKIDERRRHGVEIAALIVACLFCAYFAFAAAYFVYDSWQFRDMAVGLIAIPLWIPQSSFVLGTLLLLASVAEELVRTIRGGKPGYVLAVEERHARGDFSEDI